MSEAVSPVTFGEQEEAGLGSLASVASRKSSWSFYNGNCVEVADMTGRMIIARDTNVEWYSSWRRIRD